jgi:SAM-dependent methyltransferase
MEKFKMKYLDKKDKLTILDIGSFDASPDPFNYSLIFNEEKWKYRGMDIRKGPNVEIVVSDIYDWKEIEDESFDVVISGQAFEHMEFFWKAILEIERILKPGGYCCIIAPSKGPVHGNPVDCFRFTANGMKAIGEYANLDILDYYTNNNKESNPWYDSVLIAKK